MTSVLAGTAGAPKARAEVDATPEEIIRLLEACVAARRTPPATAVSSLRQQSVRTVRLFVIVSASALTLAWCIRAGNVGFATAAGVAITAVIIGHKTGVGAWRSIAIGVSLGALLAHTS